MTQGGRTYTTARLRMLRNPGNLPSMRAPMPQKAKPPSAGEPWGFGVLASDLAEGSRRLERA